MKGRSDSHHWNWHFKIWLLWFLTIYDHSLFLNDISTPVLYYNIIWYGYTCYIRGECLGSVFTVVCMENMRGMTATGTIDHQREARSFMIHVSTGLELQWRHNELDGVSNHQPHDCLLNRLFRRRPKKTSKIRVTGLCAWNSLVTGEFPAEMASNAENVRIWWRHHGI